MLRIIIYAVALAAWGVVFWSDIPVLLNEWGHDDYSHCYLVLPLVLYIIWTERSKLAQIVGNGLIGGTVWCLASLCLFILGRFGSLKFFVFLSMWTSLCGMLLLALGSRAIRVLWFPFLVGFFAIPLPAFISKITSLKLRLISSVLSEKMLQILQIPVYRDGNVIDLGVIQLQVVDACSGLRYLWPSLLMALLIGWMFIKSPWRKLLLVGISIPVTILSNSFRIALTGILTKFIDPTLAEGFFHDFSGWLVYVFSLGVLWGCAQWMRDMEQGDAVTMDRGHEISLQTPWWRGGVALVFFSLMLIGQSSLLNNTVRLERQAFSSFPAEVGEWVPQRQVLSAAALKGLGLDDYYNAVFRNVRTGDVAYVLVSWYDHQTTSHAAHAPTSCLVGSGWDIKSKQVMPASILSGRPFPLAQMILKRNQQTIVSNFWFLQRGRVVVSEWANKWYLLIDSITQQRTDGALVRVEFPVRENDNVELAQQRLDVFTGQLLEALSPHLPHDYSREIN